MLGAFPKPAVIGQVHEKVRAAGGGRARGLRKHVLKANQRRGPDRPARRTARLPRVTGSVQFESAGPVARLIAAFDGREPLYKREPAHERDVFAEDDELLLVVHAGQFPLRIEQERGVKNIVVVPFLGVRFPDDVIRVKNHPDAVPYHQIGDGGVAGLIQFRERGFRPD